LAAFLLGDVTSFGRYVSASTNANETQPRLFFFGQDTWRVNNKLSVNLGLRWEIYEPESVRGTGQGGWVDPATGEVRVAGKNGVDLRGNTNTSYTHFAPRLGIAYQWNPKTVIRLGYGRSYDIGVFRVHLRSRRYANLPVLASQSITRILWQPGQDFNTAFFLSSGPVLLNPATALDSGNCNSITDPTGTKTQCLGPNGRPLLPDWYQCFYSPVQQPSPDRRCLERYRTTPGHLDAQRHRFLRWQTRGLTQSAAARTIHSTMRGWPLRSPRFPATRQL